MKGRVAVVTGASSGIGRAAAVRLARAGAHVAVLARNEDALADVVREIEPHGVEGLAVATDVTVPAQVERAMKWVVDRWGRLDIVFANAGINGVWAPIDELEPEEWDRTLDTNLKGTFLTVKYAVPHLRKNGGSIVICASVNGTRVFSNTGATAYASSKAAQVAFTKMVALELAKHRIRVNVICPGAIATEINEKTEKRNLDEVQERVEFPEGKIPLTDGKPGTPDQVADLVWFLASDASSHITGTEMWIDGGESLLQG